MAEFHLIDMAVRTNKQQHTWYRRNNNKISSRLDLILTNLPVPNPKYSTSIIIFDHAWVQASFGQKREKTAPTMKDYVVDSDEFLIKYCETLERHLTTCLPLQNQNPTLYSPRRERDNTANPPHRSTHQDQRASTPLVRGVHFNLRYKLITLKKT